MVFLVLLLLLQETAALPVATCDDLLAETQAISNRLREARRTDGAMPDNLLQRFAARSREARHCYDGRAPEHLGLLYRRELYALRWLHRYEEAIHVATEALALDTVDPESRAHLYDDRAMALARLGRTAEALHDYVDALALTPESDIGRRVELLIEMGFSSRRIRDFEATTSYYQQAERLLRAQVDLDRTRLAYLLRQKADLVLSMPHHPGEDSLLHAGRLEALEAARLYLNAGEAVLQANAGVAYLTAAQLSADLGDMTAAMGYARRAETLGRSNQSSLLLAGALRVLGSFAAQQGRAEEARTYLLDALAHARQSGYTEYERRLTTALGDLALAHDRLAAAKDWYQQAIRHTETLRASLGTTDWSATVFDYWRDPYAGLVRVLLAEGRVQEAFLTLEQTRARHLRDLHRQTQLMSDLSDHDRLRVDSLAGHLSEIRNRLSRRPPADTLARLKLQETRLMTELDAVLDLEPQPALLPLPQLQQALRDREQVLISYFIAPAEQTFGVPPFSFAFVLTPDEVQGVPLAVSADSLESLITSVSPLFAFQPGNTAEPSSLPASGMTFRGPATPGLPERQFQTASLHQLYEVLIEPLRAHLPERGRLAVVPDGALFTLPFGMLLDDEVPPFSYAEAPFLVRRYAFSTELAAAMLLRADPPNTASSLDVAAFGRTRFGTATSDVLLREAALPDLPAVADELAGIGSRFRKTHIALNDEATESAFYRLMHAPQALHIASHAVVNSSPLYNAILLAPDADDDGILFFHELKRRQLSTPLVVLSGCSTADGTFALGEGMQSLQYAFHTTGVLSSLATLWLVDDSAMARLVDAFYKHLARGATKDVALQRAQLEYLDAAPPSAQSPFFWAAPILYGAPHALTLSTRTPWWIWLGGALVLALLVVLTLRYRRSSFSA